ncbi:MAG: Porphobilinogen deaminase [Elusimicrobia bacterium]|nr:Porphobilinogen deaminase [Elusimicrobiota bacterium]
MKLRIGSRGSKLAVMQAHWVASALKEKNPELDISFVEITTTGDRDQSPTFQQAGGKGVFVKEIEEALLADQIDLAVHSLKDVPQELPAGLRLGPFPEREDVRDAVISRFGELLGELPRRSIVGSSSPRRRSQTAYLFKKRSYNLEPLRGNIDTRIKKLHEGQYDAIILAAAGLKRLGLDIEITHILEPTVFLPAATQGCLGLELREGDATILSLLEAIADRSANITAPAERAFLQGVGGNCFVPVGAYSTLVGDQLKMKAVMLDPTGERAVYAEESGSMTEPQLVGYQLAERLLHAGGSELMGPS